MVYAFVDIAFRLSFGFFHFWVLWRRGRVRRGLWVGVDMGVCVVGRPKDRGLPVKSV